MANPLINLYTPSKKKAKKAPLPVRAPIRLGQVELGADGVARTIEPAPQKLTREKVRRISGSALSNLASNAGVAPTSSVGRFLSGVGETEGFEPFYARARRKMEETGIAPHDALVTSFIDYVNSPEVQSKSAMRPLSAVMRMIDKSASLTPEQRAQVRRDLFISTPTSGNDPAFWEERFGKGGNKGFLFNGDDPYIAPSAVARALAEVRTPVGQEAIAQRIFDATAFRETVREAYKDNALAKSNRAYAQIEESEKAFDKVVTPYFAALMEAIGPFKGVWNPFGPVAQETVKGLKGVAETGSKVAKLASEYDQLGIVGKPFLQGATNFGKAATGPIGAALRTWTGFRSDLETLASLPTPILNEVLKAYEPRTSAVAVAGAGLAEGLTRPSQVMTGSNAMFDAQDGKWTGGRVGHAIRLHFGDEYKTLRDQATNGKAGDPATEAARQALNVAYTDYVWLALDLVDMAEVGDVVKAAGITLSNAAQASKLQRGVASAVFDGVGETWVTPAIKNSFIDWVSAVGSRKNREGAAEFLAQMRVAIGEDATKKAVNSPEMFGNVANAYQNWKAQKEMSGMTPEQFDALETGPRLSEDLRAVVGDEDAAKVYQEELAKWNETATPAQKIKRGREDAARVGQAETEALTLQSRLSETPDAFGNRGPDLNEYSGIVDNYGAVTPDDGSRFKNLEIDEPVQALPEQAVADAVTVPDEAVKAADTPEPQAAKAVNDPDSGQPFSAYPGGEATYDGRTVKVVGVMDGGNGRRFEIFENGERKLVNPDELSPVRAADAPAPATTPVTPVVSETPKVAEPPVIKPSTTKRPKAPVLRDLNDTEVDMVQASARVARKKLGDGELSGMARVKADFGGDLATPGTRTASRIGELLKKAGQFLFGMDQEDAASTAVSLIEATFKTIADRSGGKLTVDDVADAYWRGTDTVEGSFVSGAYEGGKIKKGENYNPSTPLHEAWHFVDETLRTVSGDWAKAIDVALDNAPLHPRVKDLVDSGSLRGEYAIRAENSAEWFINYLRTGKAPSEKLKEVFARAKEILDNWFRTVGIKRSMKDAPAPLRRLYDEVLGAATKAEDAAVAGKAAPEGVAPGKGVDAPSVAGKAETDPYVDVTLPGEDEVVTARQSEIDTYVERHNEFRAEIKALSEMDLPAAEANARFIELKKDFSAFREKWIGETEALLRKLDTYVTPEELMYGKAADDFVDDDGNALFQLEEVTLGLPGEEEVHIKMVHFSNNEKKQFFDPSFIGSGHSPNVGPVALGATEDAIRVALCYPTKAKTDADVVASSSYKYDLSMPADKVYDMTSDPLGILAKVASATGKQGAELNDEIIRELSKPSYGFHGVALDFNNSGKPGVVAVWEPKALSLIGMTERGKTRKGKGGTVVNLDSPQKRAKWDTTGMAKPEYSHFTYPISVEEEAYWKKVFPSNAQAILGEVLGTENLFMPGKGAKKGSTRTEPDIARAIYDRGLKLLKVHKGRKKNSIIDKHGRIILTDANRPLVVAAFRQAITDEVVAILRKSPRKNGLGFYGKGVKVVNHMLRQLIPSATDQDLVMFHFLSSPASIGNNPAFELAMSVPIWENWMKTGKTGVYRVPLPGQKNKKGEQKYTYHTPAGNKLTGAGAPNIFDLYERIDDLYTNKFGGDVQKMLDWVSSTHTYAELKEYGTKTDQADMFAEPDGRYFGGYVLAQKIGPYFGNKIGFPSVTKDVWFYRGANRILGQILGWDNKGVGVFTANADPGGASRAMVMHEATVKAGEDLGLTPFEIQEILWLEEKEFYERFGSKAAKFDLETGMAKYMETQGIKPDPFPEDEYTKIEDEYEAKARKAVARGGVLGRGKRMSGPGKPPLPGDPQQNPLTRIIASPSVTDVKLARAIKDIDSGRVTWSADQLKTLMKELDLAGALKKGVGVWKDGAEATLIYRGMGDSIEALIDVASKIGQLLDQKNVIVFRADFDAPDALIEAFFPSTDYQATVEAVQKAGVEFGTYDKTKKGINATFLNKDGAESVKKAVEAIESVGAENVQITTGEGHFLGDEAWETRIAGKKDYEKRIATKEENAGPRPEVAGTWSVRRARRGSEDLGYGVSKPRFQLEEWVEGYVESEGTRNGKKVIKGVNNGGMDRNTWADKPLFIRVVDTPESADFTAKVEYNLGRHLDLLNITPRDPIYPLVESFADMEMGVGTSMNLEKVRDYAFNRMSIESQGFAGAVLDAGYDSLAHSSGTFLLTNAAIRENPDLFKRSEWRTGKPATLLGFHGSQTRYVGDVGDRELGGEWDNSKLGSNTRAGSAKQGTFFAGRELTAQSNYYTGNDAEVVWEKFESDGDKKAYSDAVEQFNKAFDHLHPLVLMQSFYSGNALPHVKFWKLYVPLDKLTFPGAQDVAKWTQIIDSVTAEANKAVTLTSAKLDKGYVDGTLVDAYGATLTPESVRQSLAELDQAVAKINDVGSRVAEHWRFTKDEVVGAFKISFDNPLVFDFKGQEYRERTYFSVIDQAINEGHDGVILKNTYDGAGLDDIFVSFDPNKQTDILRIGYNTPAFVASYTAPFPEIFDMMVSGNTGIVDPLIKLTGADIQRMKDGDVAEINRVKGELAQFLTTNSKGEKAYAWDAPNSLRLRYPCYRDGVFVSPLTDPLFQRDEWETGKPLVTTAFHGSPSLYSGQLGERKAQKFDMTLAGSFTQAESATYGMFLAGNKGTASAYTKPYQEVNVFEDPAKVEDLINEGIDIVSRLSKLPLPASFNFPWLKSESAYKAHLKDRYEVVPGSGKGNWWQAATGISGLMNLVARMEGPSDTFGRVRTDAHILASKIETLTGIMWQRWHPEQIGQFRVEIQNPLIKDFKGREWDEESYTDVLSRAKEGGHDGAVLMNTFDGGEKIDDVIIVFDPAAQTRIISIGDSSPSFVAKARASVKQLATLARSPIAMMPHNPVNELLKELGLTGREANLESLLKQKGADYMTLLPQDKGIPRLEWVVPNYSRGYHAYYHSGIEINPTRKLFALDETVDPFGDVVPADAEVKAAQAAHKEELKQKRMAKKAEKARQDIKDNGAVNVDMAAKRKASTPPPDPPEVPDAPDRKKGELTLSGKRLAYQMMKAADAVIKKDSIISEFWFKLRSSWGALFGSVHTQLKTSFKKGSTAYEAARAISNELERVEDYAAAQTTVHLRALVDAIDGQYKKIPKKQVAEEMEDLAKQIHRSSLPGGPKMDLNPRQKAVHAAWVKINQEIVGKAQKVNVMVQASVMPWTRWEPLYGQTVAFRAPDKLNGTMTDVYGKVVHGKDGNHLLVEIEPGWYESINLYQKFSRPQLVNPEKFFPRQLSEAAMEAIKNQKGELWDKLVNEVALHAKLGDDFPDELNRTIDQLNRLIDELSDAEKRRGLEIAKEAFKAGDSLSGVVGGFARIERERMPFSLSEEFYDFNFREVITGHIKRASLTTQAKAMWDRDLSGLAYLLDQLGPSKEAFAAMINAALGRGPSLTDGQKNLATITALEGAWQMVSKLSSGTTTLAQIPQTAMAYARYGGKAYMEGWKQMLDSAKKGANKSDAWHDALMSGAIESALFDLTEFSEANKAVKLAHDTAAGVAKWTGIRMVDETLRVQAAITSKVALEHIAERLFKLGDAAPTSWLAKRRLDADVDLLKDWYSMSDMQIDKLRRTGKSGIDARMRTQAYHAGSKTQIRMRASDLPGIMVAHPITKVMFRFQQFNIGQARMLWTAVEEAAKGRPEFLIRAVAAYTVLGWMTNEAKSKLIELQTGQEDTRNQLSPDVKVAVFQSLLKSGIFGYWNRSVEASFDEILKGTSVDDADNLAGAITKGLVPSVPIGSDIQAFWKGVAKGGQVGGVAGIVAAADEAARLSIVPYRRARARFMTDDETIEAKAKSAQAEWRAGQVDKGMRTKMSSLLDKAADSFSTPEWKAYIEAHNAAAREARAGIEAGDLTISEGAAMVRAAENDWRSTNGDPVEFENQKNEADRNAQLKEERELGLVPDDLVQWNKGLDKAR